MNQKTTDLSKEYFKEQKNQIRIVHDELLSKTKLLISKLKDTKSENSILKENIKNLNLKISELKLQLTKINTEVINKEKEISELKNLFDEIYVRWPEAKFIHTQKLNELLWQH